MTAAMSAAWTSASSGHRGRRGVAWPDRRTGMVAGVARAVGACGRPTAAVERRDSLLRRLVDRTRAGDRHSPCTARSHAAQALDQLSRVSQMLPAQLQPIVADQLTSITTASTKVLTVRGLAALPSPCGPPRRHGLPHRRVDGGQPRAENRGFVRRIVLAFGSSSAARCCWAMIAVAGLASRRLREIPEVMRRQRRCSSGWRWRRC